MSLSMHLVCLRDVLLIFTPQVLQLVGIDIFRCSLSYAKQMSLTKESDRNSYSLAFIPDTI
jgi:hypothetical protein